MYTKQHGVQCTLHRHDDDLPPWIYDAHHAVNTTRFAYLSRETLTGGLYSDMFLQSSPKTHLSTRGARKGHLSRVSAVLLMENTAAWVHVGVRLEIVRLPALVRAQGKKERKKSRRKAWTWEK